MNDGTSCCPHGHEIDTRHRSDGWTEEWAPKDCRLCPKDKPVNLPYKKG